jgi:hypothetical protein
VLTAGEQSLGDCHMRKRRTDSRRQAPQRDGRGRAAMNEDVFNMSLRKFLKKVGVTSQREIEKAVRAALDEGRLKGDETLDAEVTIKVGGVELKEKIDGRIELV